MKVVREEMHETPTSGYFTTILAMTPAVLTKPKDGETEELAIQKLNARTALQELDAGHNRTSKCMESKNGES